MNKVDRNRYKEYIKCANECLANRVYPLSIATRTQDGDIHVDGKEYLDSILEQFSELDYVTYRVEDL